MYPKWEIEQVYKFLGGSPERREALGGPKRKLGALIFMSQKLNLNMLVVILWLNVWRSVGLLRTRY